MASRPDKPGSPTGLKLSGASKDVSIEYVRTGLNPASTILTSSNRRLVTDSIPPDTSGLPVQIELNDALKVQTVNTDVQDVAIDSQSEAKCIKQLDDKPMSKEQLEDEVKTIYAGVAMVESMCRERDADCMPSTDGPFDLIRFLSMIPEGALEVLQKSGTRPDRTIRAWYSTVHKDAIVGEKESSDDYLDGFQVALELRIKELGWPEYEEIAARTTEKIGEEGRQKVIDEKHFLTIGYNLADQLLRELKSVKEEEADIAPSDSGKDTAGTAANTTTVDKQTQSMSENKPGAILLSLTEDRPLHNQKLYKRIGMEYWVLAGRQWILSLDGAKWAALIALHHTLLKEWFNFLLASQYPLHASVAFKGIAANHSIPARMCGHAIYSVLEVMRERLVESHEFLDNFIKEAYRMMSLLEESIPSFRDNWIECKADLARYG